MKKNRTKSSIRISKQQILIAVVLTVGIVLILNLARLMLAGRSGSVTDNRRSSTATVIPKEPVISGFFEPEDSRPDEYFETLPDGSRIEYGTRTGPLTPERLQKLKDLIQEKYGQR